MDAPIATITSLSGGLATLSVARAEVCARCAAGKGCGAGLLGVDQTPAKIVVQVPESMNLDVGDQVTLELSPDSLLKASMLVYGLPLAGVLSILLLGWIVAGPLSDALAVALALVGMLAGLITGRAKLGRNRCLEQFMPSISSRLT